MVLSDLLKDPNPHSVWLVSRLPFPLLLKLALPRRFGRVRTKTHASESGEMVSCSMFSRVLALFA